MDEVACLMKDVDEDVDDIAEITILII